MKIYNSPYFDHADGLDIMIMDDPSEDGREVYYRMPGYPFIFAFALPKSYEMSMFTTIQLAKANAMKYSEVIFQMSYEGVFEFYRDRIASCPKYGFQSGHEILDTITRCAFNDSMLTEREFNSIIILAEQAHIKMMEDNYNAGWDE